MSQIRGFDTAPEMLVRKKLHALGLRYRCNVQALPGRPDIVFTAARLIVFIDGDFWHGYRFPSWKKRLPPYWISKIEKNRARDIRNHRRLRRAGWRILRIWEHQVATDLDSCISRILLPLNPEA
jgi:DNA mismatch endonuclease, patch repair protein